MRYLFIILIIIIPAISFSQTMREDELLWRSNMPDALNDLLTAKKVGDVYEINKLLNPFYLRGDFNGDKTVDYALAVIERKTGKKGVLIYHHPFANAYFLAGAGKSIPNGHGDDYQWMDSWLVYDSKKVEVGVGESRLIKLKGEAILIIKLE